jgi:hypothetical protein
MSLCPAVTLADSCTREVGLNTGKNDWAVDKLT